MERKFGLKQEVSQMKLSLTKFTAKDICQEKHKLKSCKDSLVKFQLPDQYPVVQAEKDVDLYRVYQEVEEVAVNLYQCFHSKIK